MQTTSPAKDSEQVPLSSALARSQANLEILRDVQPMSTVDPLLERYVQCEVVLSALYQNECALNQTSHVVAKHKKQIHTLLGSEASGFILWFIVSRPLFNERAYRFMRFLKKYDVDMSSIHENPLVFIALAIDKKADFLLLWLFQDEQCFLDREVIFDLLKDAQDRLNIDSLNFLIRYTQLMCREKNTALMHAIRKEEIILARYVLRDNEKMIDQANIHGLTPFMVSVGHEGLWNLCLKHHADPTLKDGIEMTVFHYTLQRRDLQSLSQVYAYARARDPHFDINDIISSQGYTLLHFAMTLNFKPAIDYLINECKANVQHKDQLGRNYAVFGAEYADVDLGMVDYFVKKEGLFLDDPAMIYRMVYYNQQEKIKTIHQRFPINFNPIHADTPILLYAAQYQNWSFLKWLIDPRNNLQLDVKCTDSKGRRVGHVLAQHNQASLLTAGLKEGWVDLFHKDDEGLTLFDVAVGLGVKSIDTIRLCVDFYRKKLKSSTSGPSLRSLSCYLDLLMLFLTDEVLSEDTFVERGQTLVHLALEHANEMWVESFLKKCLPLINHSNAQGEKPLCTVVRQNNFKKTLWFIKKFQPKLMDLDAKKSNLLHLACEIRDPELIRFCCEEKKISFMKARAGGKTAFDLLLLSLNSDLIVDAWTHLSTTERKKYVEGLQSRPRDLQILVDYELIPALLERTPPDPRPMETSKEKKKPNVVKKTPVSNRVEKDSSPPLPELVVSYESCLEAVVQHKVSMIQQLKSHTDLAAILHEKMYDLLNHVFLTNHHAITYHFLRIRCVQSYLHEQGVVCLMQAVQTQNKRFVQGLLSLEVIRAVASAEDNQVLRSAIRLPDRDILDLIWSVPAVRDLAHVDHNALLKAAIEQEDEELIKRLLTVPSVCDTVHEQDNAVLLVALVHGLHDLVLELLKYPAVVEALPQNDFHVFRCAVSCEHEDMVHLLLAYPSVKAFAQSTPDYQAHQAAWFDVDLPESLMTLENTSESVSVRVDVGHETSVPWGLQVPMMPVPYVHYVPSFTPFIPYFTALMPTPLPWMMSCTPLSIETLALAIQNNERSLLESLVATIPPPPFFSDEILNLLLMCIKGRYADALRILLSSTLVLQHVEIHVMPIVSALARRGSVTLVELFDASDAVRRSLSLWNNRCVKIAIKYVHFTLVHHLLNHPEVFALAHIDNNYVLRHAVKHGDVSIVSRLLTHPEVIKRAALWQNEPLKKAILSQNEPIMDALLGLTPVLYKAIQDSSFFAPSLHAVLYERLRRLGSQPIDLSQRSYYFVMIKLFLKHANPSNQQQIKDLLQREEMRAIAHLHVSCGVKNNELLQDARFYQNGEIVALLLAIPAVKQCDEENQANMVRVSGASMFAPASVEAATLEEVDVDVCALK